METVAPGNGSSPIVPSTTIPVMVRSCAERRFMVKTMSKSMNVLILIFSLYMFFCKWIL